MITYNHDKFIAQALDSVLMQKVNFPYEIIIGEDCSTDSTRNILINYKNKYPDKMNLLLQEKNIGSMRNFDQTLKTCRGKYVAILEGDDWWVSPDKLQMQVDFLENNPDFSICFHPVMVHKEGVIENNDSVFPKKVKDVSFFEDLLYINYIPTCSVVFRNNRIDFPPDWINKLKMGDWPLHLLNAQHGKIKHVNNVMAAYRVHSNGLWTNLDKISIHNATIDAFQCFKDHFNYKYKRFINNRIADMYIELATFCEDNDIQAAKGYILKSMIYNIYNMKVPGIRSYKMLLRYHFPKFYKTIKHGLSQFRGGVS